jgi:RNA polymerase sigma factor (sigma-70 family)
VSKCCAVLHVGGCYLVKMNSIDTELLRNYLEEGSETAFAELVRRHIDLVYSAALRQLNGDRQYAEDVAQTVFTDLAQKAPKLQTHTSLAGWLYTSTRYATAAIRRAESRRSLREHKAHTMNPDLQPAEAEPDWEHIRPILDEAMHGLKEEDREAVLLRYFERLPLGEVGKRLGIPENTARMRIERAMEKLRTRLAACGISSTAAALGTALAQQAVGPAPGALSVRVAGHAIATSSNPVTTHPVRSHSFGLAGKAALVISAALALVILGGVWKGERVATESMTRPRNTGEQTVAELGSNVVVPAVTRLKHDKTQRMGVELFFVDDRTGRAITNRIVSLRGWEKGSQLLVEKIIPLEEGRCTPPFDPDFGPGYLILTYVDGYADVMLKWQPRRGDTLPDSYIVRLVQPVLIHGRVVDPDGNAVPGAEVAFGNSDIPGSDAKPEGHQIERLTTLTDVEGRWQINRIAPEVVRYLVGDASHPDFAQSQRVDVSLQPEAGQQLLEGALVFRLGAGAGVAGTVVDTAGRPVGNALVHVGILDETGSRNTRSAENGAFRVKGCRPGTQLVTASADGFAPAVLSLNLDTNQSPVKLVLGQGGTLRVHITDANGPVVGASLWYNTFGQKLSGPLPQVEFNGKSDSDGQIVWEHAPDQDMEFDCSAVGHLRVDNFVLRPDDQEHVVTLPQALVIRGTVRDAGSDELLPRFRLGIGWPEVGTDGTVQPQWFGIDRFWPSFTGGKFEHSLEEPVVGGTTNHGYIFRFEAEGHAPYVTRVYQPDEGEVSMDIKLQTGEETLIAIYTADGRAAADAQIGLLAPGNRLRLLPGGFSTANSGGPNWLRKADAQGQFVLPTDETVKYVAIAHPEGYLECTPSELRKTRAVRLQPWARVEGIWLIGEQPATQREVTLDYQSMPNRKLELERSAFSTTTDDNGRFVFAQVPTGKLEIMTWHDSADGHGTKYGFRVCEVQALAGQTNQVVLAGNSGKEP